MNDKNVKQNITKLWNQAYIDYDECYAHGLKSDNEKKEWLSFLSEAVGKKPLKILDVGAGTGFVSLLLAELGHICKGLDLSEKMLSRAKEKAAKAGFKNVEFDIGDAEDTKEPTESYDVVVNSHLVWTLPHPEKAIREWKRVLKPGGRLIIMEGNWHYNRITDRIQVFFGKCLITLMEHRNAFSNDGDYDKQTKQELPMLKSKNAKRLSEMVENAGFAVTVIPMRDVDRAEKKAMPLRYRLLNPHRRIAVIGKKVS